MLKIEDLIYQEFSDLDVSTQKEYKHLLANIENAEQQCLNSLNENQMQLFKNYQFCSFKLEAYNQELLIKFVLDFISQIFNRK